MYAFAKVFLYMIMIEKVRLGNLVLKKGDRSTWWCFPYYLNIGARPLFRSQDILYKLNYALLCVYPLVLIDMLLTKEYEIGDDNGRCRIGLPYVSSLPLLISDVIFTVWLTWLFYRALSSMNDVKLKKVARKNLYAAMVSLFFTELNLSTFVIYSNDLIPVHHCLGMCTLDIAANVFVVSWLMSGGTSAANRRKPTEPPLSPMQTASPMFQAASRFSRPSSIPNRQRSSSKEARCMMMNTDNLEFEETRTASANESV